MTRIDNVDCSGGPSCKNDECWDEEMILKNWRWDINKPFSFDDDLPWRLDVEFRWECPKCGNIVMKTSSLRDLT